MRNTCLEKDRETNIIENVRKNQYQGWPSFSIVCTEVLYLIHKSDATVGGDV